MKQSKFLNRIFNPLGIKSGVKFLTQKTKNPWVRVFRISGAILALIITIFITLVVYYAIFLPKPGELARFNSVGSSKIYDRNGILLKDIYNEEKRTVVESQNIPQAVKDATVAIEDRGFYQHHGIYLRSIARAIFVDIIRGKSSQGGSTITQQLVRNAFDEIGTKKTIARKIREVVVAMQFERIYTKDQILTFYLNEIPYSNNNYGIQSASNSYYNKNISDLDPSATDDQAEKAKRFAQIATLVSIPQSPTYYNPYGNHTDKLKIRRDTVLQKMVEQNYITSDMAESAKGTEIAEGVSRTKSSTIAQHFIFYIREQVVELLGGGQEGERKLENGGYKITTTLDVEKQKEAEKIIADKASSIFKSTGGSNIALVSTDAKNGQILSMIGSVDYFEKNFGTVNIATSSRQPGSSFKPIVYASLFKKAGWGPGSTLFDLESTYDQSRPNDIWPRNYSGGGRGPVTVRNALAQSLNISAIKAQAISGTDNAVSTARDLGISTLQDPDKYGLAMVLGAAEVKMVDMVAAYGVFANNGTLHPTSSILTIEDKAGQKIFEWKDDPKKVIDPAIAYEITSILSDNEARSATFGSRSALYFSDRKVAVKTGTTSSYRDAWTIGYSPQIVTAVWVGNNDNKEMTHSGAGAMAAAPVWHDYMAEAHKSLPKEDFSRPDNVKDCSIAKYSNKKPTDKTSSENIVRDLCADFQLSDQADDTSFVVKLYKPDQTKLATDSTPSGLVFEKTFFKIRSERPNDPIWENPVQKWARDNGINQDQVPTDKYDENTSNDKLDISILSPLSDATVSGTIGLQALTSSPFGVDLMTFYLDDIQLAQPEAPWIYNINTLNFTNGKHTFKATSHDAQGQEASASVSFTIANTTGSLSLSSITAQRSGTSVVLTWTSSDLADGTVKYGLTNAYGSIQAEGKGQLTAHSVTIAGLTAGTTYHYQIVSTNSTSSAQSADLTF
jgi:membrane peptidoglycan carboxypeptidase